MNDDTLRTFQRLRFTRVLVTLWLTYCCYTMVRRPFSLARAEIERETGIPAARLSWVDTAFVVSYSLSQLFHGGLKKRLGYTRVLLIGFSMSIASCFALTCSTSVLAFAATWAVNGLAQGTGWASCLELLSAWVFPAERGRVMGVWSTNMAVGGVLGNVVPAFLMGRGLSWRAAMLVEVVCGPCVVLMLTAAVLRSNPNQVGFPSVRQAEHGITVEHLRETPKLGCTMDGEYILARTAHAEDSLGHAEEESLHGKSTAAAACLAAEPAKVSGSAPSTVAILRMPGVLGYSLAYSIHKLVRYAFMFWLPYYLNKELKATYEQAGYIASVFDVGGALGVVVSGYASDYFFHGRRRILVLLFFVLGMAMSTFSLFALSSAFQDSLFLCAALVLLVGFFSFSIDALQMGPCLFGLCDALSCSVGPVSGVVGGIGSLGSALHGAITVVFSADSWGALFVLFSALTVVAMVLMSRPLAMEAANLRAAEHKAQSASGSTRRKTVVASPAA